MDDIQFELFRKGIEKRFDELEADATALRLETKSDVFNLCLYLGALTLFLILVG